MTECSDWPSIDQAQNALCFQRKSSFNIVILVSHWEEKPDRFFFLFLCVCVCVCEWEISDCRNNFQHNDFLDLSECHPSSRVPSAWPDQEKSHRYLWSLRPDGFPGEAGHGTQGHRRPGALYRGEERYQHWIIFNRSLLISNLKSLCKQMCFEIFN